MEFVFREEARKLENQLEQARISWGIHGLFKVSLTPAILYHPTPCGGRRLSYYPLGYPKSYGPEQMSKEDVTGNFAWDFAGDEAGDEHGALQN
jgi:hypothetical protein